MDSRSAVEFLSTLSLRRATEAEMLAQQATTISIHALLAESDRFGRVTTAFCLHFYPRSPCGERLFQCSHGAALLHISIHALLAESDNPKSEKAKTSKKFLSTLSLRRATTYTPDESTPDAYFYPRSPCGERHDGAGGVTIAATISIHALLAESDGGFGVGSWRLVIFLSTLSLRRATRSR